MADKDVELLGGRKERFFEWVSGVFARVMAFVRLNSTQTANIPTGTALTGEIDMRGYAGGLIHMPAAWTAASVGFYVAPATGGTFQKYYDQYGSLVQVSSPAASGSYEIPSQLFAARFVKLWSQNGSGTDTNQTRAGGTNIVVDLKA